MLSDNWCASASWDERIINKCPSPSPAHVCFLPAHMVHACSWMAEWDGDSVERKILYFGALHRIFSSSPLSRRFAFCPLLALYAFSFRKSYTSFRCPLAFAAKQQKLKSNSTREKKNQHFLRQLYEAIDTTMQTIIGA